VRLLSQLFENNRRWADACVADNPDFFNDLCAIQRPDYLWIGCSDSRVPANQIVGLPPGELFVHRNVGNIVHATDTNCLAVLQFAVDTAVPAPLEQWLTPIRAVADDHRRELDTLDPRARVARLCELNVVAQVHTLARLRTVRNAWGRGHALAIHGWIYDLRNGLLRDLEVTLEAPDAGDQQGE
jgi:carbonic anhydrase